MLAGIFGRNLVFGSVRDMLIPIVGRYSHMPVDVFTISAT